MYLSPFTGRAYYDDNEKEGVFEERKTIEARCSWCGAPMQAWFAGVSRASAEPYYRGYCEECGLKPYSQKNFVQQITAAFPDVTRGIDKLGKRRILTGIRLGEVLG